MLVNYPIAHSSQYVSFLFEKKNNIKAMLRIFSFIIVKILVIFECKLSVAVYLVSQV